MTLEDAWPVLEAAIRRADEGVTREEVETGLNEGRFLLFSYGNSAALAAIQGKTLRIGLAGGCLGECQQIERQIEAFARSEGFERVQIVGRDWRKALPGYDKVAVVLEKTL